MIIDVIPIPIQITTESPIEMSSPLWLTNDLLRNSEDLWMLSRDIGNSNQIHRYKLIETAPEAILEHVVISFDEMNPVTLGLSSHPHVSVDLIPISTKITFYDDRPTMSYRHRQGITYAISKLTGCNSGELESIHNLMLMAIGSGIWDYKRLEVNAAYQDYLKRVAHRVSGLLTHDEPACEMLISRLSEIAQLLSTDLSVSEPNVFLDIVESVTRIPKLSKCDNVSRQWFNKRSIDSHILKPLYLDLPNTKRIVNLVASHDIFPLENHVEYTVPDNVRWEFLPLIDQLSILPYTDLSVTFGPRWLNVNYAVSFSPSKPDLSSLPHNYGNHTHRGLTCDMYSFENHTFLTELSIMIQKLAMNLGLNPRTVCCNVVKTFREDVYVEFYQDGDDHFEDHIVQHCIPTKFYFDLTMHSLGTRSILTRDLVDAITPDNY